jgi:CheY-like chemotaxis protein
LTLAQDKAPRSSSRSPSEQRAEAGAGGKPAWIVLIEDNPADVILMREALAQHGVHHELTVLQDGEQAIQLIDRTDFEVLPAPDLVLLDLKLPKKGGFEVLARLRSSLRCVAVPVMVLSSSNAQEDKDRTARLGATKYIVKPHVLAEFLNIGAVVREMLSGAMH